MNGKFMNMKNYASFLGVILGVAGLTLVAPHEGRAEPEPLVSLKVGHLPVTGHAKYFIAQERGFFAEEGLAVELVSFQNSMDGMGAIMAGKIDVGSFGASYLAHIGKGADIRIIGGVMGGDAAIIAKPEANLHSVNDLKGKKIATIRMATGDVVLRWALGKANLDWQNDVRIFELRNPDAVMDAVRKGQVDAGVVWGPHDLRAVEEGMKIVANSYSLFPGHPCCRLTVVTGSIAGREAVWVRFLRAILKAEKFAAEHHPETIAIIVKVLRLDPGLAEKAYYSQNLDQSTDPNLAAIREFWAAVKTCGFVQSQEDVSRYVVLDLYKDALDSLMRDDPKSPYWKKLQEQFGRRNAALLNTPK
jgi:NitT/TauT family transport system substrate-binding protein